MKEKKKNNTISAPAKSAIYIGGVVSVVLLLSLGIAYYQNDSKMNNYANVLQGVYSSAYYNMVDSVNNVSIDADKLSTATTADAQRMALNSIKSESQTIVSSLSVLSISDENVVQVTKFFNQLGGLADSYLEDIYMGEELSQQQIEMFTDISYSLEKLMNNINLNNESITSGYYDFAAHNVMTDGHSAFGDSLGDMTADNMEYPAMIFDGPFSDGLDNITAKGLSDISVSSEQAAEYLIDVMYSGKDVRIINENETYGKFDTYDYQLTGDINAYVQITQSGCMPLTISGVSSQNLANISHDEAIEIAQDYARQIGFDDMYSVWSDDVTNIAYINLAPIIDDVIYYPDLIKVKIDMYDGAIVGWEAQNYASNHCDREISVTLTAADALSRVYHNDDSTVSLSVIPLDGGNEAICYEVVSGEYYTYVDANNGNIVKSLREVTTDKMHKLI